MNFSKTNTLLVLLMFWLSNQVFSQNSPSEVILEYSITNNLGSPLRIAIDGSDHIFVTDDFNKVVTKYNSAGTFIKSITTGGSPISVAINKNNQLFVGNKENGDIVKVLGDGSNTVFFSESYFPSSMSFGSDDNLYIADSYLNQITVVDPSGTIVNIIGKGIVKHPTGLAFDYKNNRIIVSEHGAVEDTTAVTIYIFDLEGNLIQSFGSEASVSWFSGVKNPGNGQFSRIQGLAVSRCGTIYVIDPFQGNVSVFDENAVFKTKFGQYGQEPGQLDIPLDIKIDSNDKIIISSLNNGALEVFSYTDIVPTSNIKLEDTSICSGGSVDIPIHLTGVAPWTFTYSIDGIEQTPIEVLDTDQNPYILTTNTPGIYEVTTLSDANTTGVCFTGNPEITVNSELPTATVSLLNANICTGEEAGITIDLTGVAPWTFSYTVDGLNEQTIITSESTYLLKVDQPALYEITSVEGGGCTGTITNGQAIISQFSKPTATIINESKYIKLAPGESTAIEIAFTGTAPYTFTYTNNEENPKAITTSENPYLLPVFEEGTYEIIHVDDANCSNSTWQDYFNINSSSILPTSTIITEQIEVCEGENGQITMSFTGIAPWTFTYTVNDQNPTEISTGEALYNLTTYETGIYKIVALKDAYIEGTSFIGNCSVIAIPLPTAKFFYDVNKLEVQFISDAQNAETHYWDFGDGTSSTEENPIHNYRKKGDYTILYTASNSCENALESDTIKVGTADDELMVVYPNPSHGEFTIKISPESPIITTINILITSNAGIPIYSSQINPNESTVFDGSIYTEIKLVNFTKGLHVLSVNTVNFKARTKLFFK